MRLTLIKMRINLLIYLTTLQLIISNVFSVTLYTKPIKPEIFSKSSKPNDKTSLIGEEVLLNVNKYGLGKWFQLKFQNPSEKYLDFHGITEHFIRPSAMESLALSVSLKTGVFNEKITEKKQSEAINATIHLITSLAYRHLATSPGGWGNEWQSALWAALTGLSGWLMWDHIEEDDRINIEKMIIHESDRFNSYKVPYYQTVNGKVVFVGDTKAEENAWNANVLQLATAMMPTHPHWKLWMNKNIELMVSSFARHSDLNRTTVINGKPINQWLNGSNIFENGTLTNHNRLHPDYMLSLYSNLRAILTSALAGIAVPKAAFWNDELVYSALISLSFKSPPYDKPGGTIYVRDSDGKATNAIYYPQGNDWGTSRRIGFALLDNSVFRFTDFGKTLHADEWSLLHIEAQLAMQKRFTDGHTYGDHNEDTYQSREEWVSCMAGFNYLTSWVSHNINITISNDKLD